MVKHQKTAIYCLKLQNTTKKYICICNKNLYSEQSLRRHEKACITYREDKHNRKVIELKEIIISLEQKHQKQLRSIEQIYEKNISILQDKLENIAIKASTKPTSITTTNNTQNIINMEPLSLEFFQTESKNLTIEHIKKGPRGYAQFALESIEDRMKVTDINRKNIKFKNIDNGVVTDRGMLVFQRMFSNGINDKNQRLISKYIHREVERRQLAGIDEIKIEQEMLPLRRQLCHIAQMADGDQTKLGQDICKIICQKHGTEEAQKIINKITDMDSGVVIEDDDSEYPYSYVDGKLTMHRIDIESVV
jgi:hypothetical protein